MTNRHVSLSAAADAAVERFVSEVDDRRSGPEDTCAAVGGTLVDLFGDRDAYERRQAGGDVTPAARVRLRGYDPCDATLAAECHAERDEARFERSKHLQWLWRQSDATPTTDSVEFGLRLRQMPVSHPFEADDGLLCSHDHDIADQTEVTDVYTTVANDARTVHDATVRAGVSVGENAVVGARSTAQADVPAHHVVGSPVGSVRVEPGLEDRADPPDAGGESRREERQIDYQLPGDLDPFDEFARDLSPTDSRVVSGRRGPAASPPAVRRRTGLRTRRP